MSSEPATGGAPDHDLSTQLVSLRPVGQSDTDWILHAASSTESLTWRFRGTTPSPDLILRGIWDRCLCQFVVVRSSGARAGEPLGLVGLYNADLHSGTAYLHSLALHTDRKLGLVVAGAKLLLDHAFELWDLRKIYMEIPEYNEATIGADILATIARREAVLVEHERLWGRYWDMSIWVISRADWSDRATPSEVRVARPPIPSLDLFRSTLLAELGANTTSEQAVPLAELVTDSLAMLVALDAVGASFGVQLHPEEILGLETLTDLHALVVSRIVAHDLD